MKVLVNALPLRYGGGVTYFREQMAALVRVAPMLNLHTLASPWGQLGELPGTSETIGVKSVAGRFLYEQAVLPFRNPDLLFCPANFGPMASRAPIVLMIHDAHFYAAGLRLAKPHLGSSAGMRVAANHLAMRRANVVVAVSESLSRDAIETLPSLAPKIRSIPCGQPGWPKDSTPVSGLPSRFILTVASAAPHKRVQDIITAWAQSLDDAESGLGLVVVGSLTAEQMGEHASIAGSHAGLLRNLGAISDRSELKWLYEHACAYVSMSILESLSLTPLEAGSLGCELILSDIPVHHEITRENATFVPPGDTRELAHVLRSVASRTRLRRSWVWPHTWESNARELLGIFTSLTAKKTTDKIAREIGPR